MKDYNVHLTLIDRIILDSYRFYWKGWQIIWAVVMRWCYTVWKIRSIL